MSSSPSVAALPYWRLSSFYVFYFALLGSTAPFLGLYFHYLGFNSARIGELVAIPMLMRCVAPNVWGWLGDYTGRRLAIVRVEEMRQSLKIIEQCMRNMPAGPYKADHPLTTPPPTWPPPMPATTRSPIPHPAA